MPITTATIDTVTMSVEAAGSVEWAGVNVAEDLRALRAGETTYRQLLAKCLDGAEPDHEDDWRDYVDAVCAAAGVADEDELVTFDGYWGSVLGQPAARIVAEYELRANLREIRTWLNCAQIAAWEQDGDGGRMPGEWTDCFFEDAALTLYFCALVVEQDAAVRARAEADELDRARDAVRSLAKQDVEYFTEFATDSPYDAIARWRQSGREAGDVELVEAIDLLGIEAEDIYARARFRA